MTIDRLMTMKNKLLIIKNLIDKQIVLVLGDFNLNETMKFSNDYSHKSYFDELRLVFDPLGLIQMVEFETWKRLVNGVWRTSILDHVYTDDVMNISDLQPVETVIGDHVLIKMTLDDEGMNEQVISYKRDWTKYSKEKLVDELSICNMDWNVSDIQCYWNKIEEIIIRITDKLAPITKYVDNVTSKSKTPLITGVIYTIVGSALLRDYVKSPPLHLALAS